MTCSRPTSLLAIALLAACGTEPGPGPATDPAGTYTVEYDPPRLVYATIECDRLLTHALLALGENRDFDLSINVIDDCRRGGGGFDFYEVLFLGTYSVSDTLLAFTPDSAFSPTFSGTFGASSVSLVIPPNVGSLAPVTITLTVAAEP
ncbi:MAG: hypothetical protein ACREMV_12025 [Gemmatimonadales bacterium]